MEHIIVKLNGREFPTYLDNNGVQRFVPNPVVEKIVDKLGEVYCKLGYLEFERIGLYSLNELGMDFRLGKYTVDEMLDFYTQTNYSVSGMLDLSCFEDVEVDNPLWDSPSE